MSIIAILVSVISASYYLKVIKLLYTENTDIDLNIDNDNTNLSNFHSFLISTLSLSILLYVLKPSILLNSTQLLALSLFY